MRSASIVTVLIGFIAILAMTGCEEGSNPENVRELSPEFEMLLTDEEYLNNEVIIDWNELAIKTAAEVDRFQTLRSNRAVPMVHLAIHDALNAIVPIYEQYAYIESHQEAHPVTAASQAAHDVMVDLFPNHEESVTELHQQWLDDVPEGEAKDQGVRAGSLAAEAILEKRENDGYDSTGEFTPRDEPGSWVYKPAKQWHTFWNPGDTPCEIIEVISPAGFEHFFKEIAEVWDGDDKDAAHLMGKYDLEMDFDSVPGLCERFGLNYP